MKDNTLVNQSFYEEFSYDVQSKFGMSQYEKNITDNLNNKISNDIIFTWNSKMIIKTFEIDKKKFDKQNFLVYGENEGLKKEIIKISEKI